MIEKKNIIKEEKGLFNLSFENQKYPIYGFVFGMAFPIIAWIIDLLYRDINFTASGIWGMHVSNPLHFVIDLAPFILAAVAYILASVIDKKQNILKQSLNEKQVYLQNIYDFSDEISKGNFEAFLEADKKDELIRKLILMRNNLNDSTLKEQKQNWQITGRDLISTTLRKYNNIEDLSYQVLLDIINYTGLIQGSFYLFDEEEQCLNNIASYAYDRQKFIQQKIPVGMGLIGQAAYEKQFIYRKEIPEDYISISSGILGDKKPGSILLVPLISDEKLRGVLEFAAVEDEISERVIQFIIELGDIIAQTVFNILINEKTNNLLNESRSMTAELQENEEELRQNAEEMRATQEELEKTNFDLASKIAEVENAQTKLNALLENASEVISILDESGIVQYESPACINILGYKPEEKIGTYAFETTGVNRAALEDLFMSVKQRASKLRKLEFLYKENGTEQVWLEVTAMNLLDNPAINGIVLNTRDITTRKVAEKEQRMRGQMQALSENSVDIIMRIGVKSEKFFYLNPSFTKYTGIPIEEAINSSINEVQLPSGLQGFFKASISTMLETAVNQEHEFILDTDEVQSIMQISAIPEFNESKQLETILFVAHDITDQKRTELEIKDKNKKITESINYAKRIQKAILPNNKILQEHFQDSFVFYKPKDVVSGDFPWLFEKDDTVYVAAVDCTGHGVPGALLSFIGYFLLQNIVDRDQNLSASEICDQLHENVRTTLRQDKDGANARDGMDIALCKYNKTSKVLEYSGAHRPLYLLRNEELEIFKGDRKAIGGIPHKKKAEKNFTNYIIDIQENDKIFFFSDGLPDQIGGERNKKYQAKRMREIIQTNSSSNMADYSDRFVADFHSYMGDQKQIDDVLLIGIGFNK